MFRVTFTFLAFLSFVYATNALNTRSGVPGIDDEDSLVLGSGVISLEEEFECESRLSSGRSCNARYGKCVLDVHGGASCECVNLVYGEHCDYAWHLILLVCCICLLLLLSVALSCTFVCRKQRQQMNQDEKESVSMTEHSSGGESGTTPDLDVEVGKKLG